MGSSRIPRVCGKAYLDFPAGIVAMPPIFTKVFIVRFWKFLSDFAILLKIQQ